MSFIWRLIKTICPTFSTFIHTNTESTALMFELIVEKSYPVEKIVFASSQSVSGEGRYECVEHGVIYPESRTIEQLRKATGKSNARCAALR